MSSVTPFRVETGVLRDREATFLLHGEVDVGTAPQLWAEVRPVLGRVRRVVLDCSDLQFMDAAGVSVILRIRSAVGDDAEVVLRAPGRLARRLFAILELHRVCTIEELPRAGNG